MSGKSLFLSFLSFVLSVAVIFAIIFIIKTQIMFAIFGLFLFAIPVILRNKAMDASNGKVDMFIAKYLVVILVVVAGFIAIMSIAFWI